MMGFSLLYHPDLPNGGSRTVENGSACDLVQLIDTIPVEPSTIANPGFVITLRSTPLLLSCTKHHNCFLPCCHAISSAPTLCGSFFGKAAKNLTMAVLLLCLYGCSWPPQCGLVSRSSSEARFKLALCPNKHLRPPSFLCHLFQQRHIYLIVLCAGALQWQIAI